jgi:hypothetical protein
MTNGLTRRLRDLVIDRVALVGAGDDPDAQVVLWKAKDAPREKGGAVKNETGMLRAIRALGEQRERSEATWDDVRRRADALLDPTGKEAMAKADVAAREVYELAQRERDRQAALGRDVSIEQALAKVVTSAEGRRAMGAVAAKGAAGQAAVRKAFAMPEAEEPEEPEPTVAERRLEELAKARARTSGRSWESELVEVVKTADGRAILGDVAAERAVS